MAGSSQDSSSFNIEGVILETRAAIAQKAIDRGRGEPVCVWRYREPFSSAGAPGETAAREAFQNRIESLAEVSRGILYPQSCGVDDEGYGYIITPLWQGEPVATFGHSRSGSEAERRFMGVVQVVDRLHRAGLACGDLCHNSFFVTRSGDTLLVAILGNGPLADSDAPLRTEEGALFEFFRAPEQRDGENHSLQSCDVFALGMLGYLLFTGSCPELPADGRGIPVPVSTMAPSAPEWADAILLRALATDPAQRFATAAELLASIVQLRTEQDAQRALPAKRWATPKKSAAAPEVTAFPIRVGKVDRDISDSDIRPAQESSSTAHPAFSIRALILLCAITAVSLVTGVSILTRRQEAQQQKQAALSTLTAAAGSESVREAIVAINDKTIGSDRQQYLDRLTASDDPLAHDALVRSALAATTPELRALSERAVLERGRRFGLVRTGEQVREWLRGIPPGATTSLYQPMMQLLDATLPVSARQDAVRQLFIENRPLALNLAAALALDTKDTGSWQTILVEFVTSEGAPTTPAGMELTTLALILGSKDLALVFGDDIVQRREELTDSDVRWLLRRLAERNDPLVRTLAHQALERGILPPIRTTALMLIRDRTDLPSEITSSVSRIAAGVPGVEDIAALGRWYDLAAEQLLLALAADELTPVLQLEVFDTIAGKTLSDQAVSSLLQWIRANQWESRGRFVRVVGVMANASVLPESEIVTALTSLNLTKADSGVLDALLSAQNPVVAKLVVENLGGLIGVSGLIRLLENPEPAVRIAAIKRLGSANDVTLLRSVIERFEAERDPTVREAYKQSFWVIQQRS